MLSKDNFPMNGGQTYHLRFTDEYPLFKANADAAARADLNDNLVKINPILAGVDWISCGPEYASAAANHLKVFDDGSMYYGTHTIFVTGPLSTQASEQPTTENFVG